MSLSTFLVSTSTQPPLFACTSNKMARPPPLKSIVTVGPRDLDLTVVRDHSPSATPAASTDIPKSPQTAPLLESSRQSSQRHVSSPSRRRLALRRQSSISYLPADSPRLWTPRTPHLGLDTFEHASLSSPNSGKRAGHVRTVSVPQRAASEQPMGLTLAERHADLLQCIAQKESKCLELRSQLTIHESELLELKRKWERIVHCEFGRNTSPTSPMYVPSAAAAAVLANTSSAVVLNGLVGGVRALAAVTTSPPLPSSVCPPRASSSSFTKRVTRQNASNSVSSTTTTASSSAHYTDSHSPRLSQSSMSSVAEEKPNLDKAEEPEEELAPSSGSVAQEKRGPMSSDQSPSSPLSSSKTLQRRSYNSRVALADALRPLTGDNPRSSSGKRASVSAASPTSSVSIPPISPLGAMGLGRANLGETAQGWVDSVGSKLAELQRGQTFSKGQKRASVLLSDVSHSILSALAPASSVNSGPASAPPTQSLIDEDDDAGSTALGSAILPDVVVAASTRATPSKTLPPPTPEVKEEEEEDWNW
ncbi:hypothetical protein BC827DRAFT_1263914 [Russula dissimulans]|nr:hypothetical protein BC827DRAFT_1263914 [Russula dissimulans]